jgi:hypothetical protein
MMHTIYIWLTTRVKEDFFATTMEGRPGCGELPPRLQAEQQPTRNNSLRVKENFRNAEVVVSGPFRVY